MLQKLWYNTRPVILGNPGGDAPPGVLRACPNKHMYAADLPVYCLIQLIWLLQHMLCMHLASM